MEVGRGEFPPEGGMGYTESERELLPGCVGLVCTLVFVLMEEPARDMEAHIRVLTKF